MQLFKSSDVRMAVLEEKLNVYEELSREMLAKLEVAVDKISESIQSISKITIRHEERIDKSLESNAALIKLIDTIQEKRKEDRTELISKIQETNTKLEEMYKFRYTVIGALIIISLVITVASNVITNIDLQFLNQNKTEQSK